MLESANQVSHNLGEKTEPPAGSYSVLLLERSDKFPVKAVCKECT